MAGMWGWKQTDSWFRFIIVLGLPILLAAIWGTFAVPDDPSRSGSAPVVVPGIVRLLIELAILGFGSWALYNLGYVTMSFGMATAIILHYLISYDRIIWLIKQ